MNQRLTLGEQQAAVTDRLAILVADLAQTLDIPVTEVVAHLQRALGEPVKPLHRHGP